MLVFFQGIQAKGKGIGYYGEGKRSSFAYKRKDNNSWPKFGILRFLWPLSSWYFFNRKNKSCAYCFLVLRRRDTKQGLFYAQEKIKKAHTALIPSQQIFLLARKKNSRVLLRDTNKRYELVFVCAFFIFSCA